MDFLDLSRRIASAAAFMTGERGRELLKVCTIETTISYIDSDGTLELDDLTIYEHLDDGPSA